MGVLKWHRKGKAVTFFFLLFFLCEQGKQPELRSNNNSSIIKPRDVIHCFSLRCIYVNFLLTICHVYYVYHLLRSLSMLMMYLICIE